MRTSGAIHALLAWTAFCLTATSVVAESQSGGIRRGSLWSRRKPAEVHLFYDTQARQVGDLLTILISENTDISNQDRRSLSKDSRLGFDLNFAGSTSGDLGLKSASAIVDHQTDSERDFNGNSRFSSDREFTDRITVTIMDVLPNGNLLVNGTRKTMIESDERTLVISGVVRPIDIRADNTVTSRFIGELRMYYEGRGAESHFVNQGWLSRRFNKIWPF